MSPDQPRAPQKQTNTRRRAGSRSAWWRAQGLGGRVTSRGSGKLSRALRTGDKDALRATFAPDATWILRDGLPAAGTWTGPDAILDGSFRIFGRLNPVVPVVQDVHRIIADGEYTAAEWTTHARTRDGRCYDSDYAGVFRVVNEQLAAVTEYLETAYAKQVVFGS